MNQPSLGLGGISAAAARHPWRVIVIWLIAMSAAASLGGPKLWQVTTNDTSHFLPSTYESVRATQFGQAHFGHLKNASAVTALVRRVDGRPLTHTDRAHSESAAADMTAWRPNWETIKTNGRAVSPTASERATRAVQPVAGPIAGNGADQLISLQFKGNDQDPTVQKAFKQFRNHERIVFAAAHMTVGFTGGIASAADQVDHQAATQRTQQTLLYAAVVLLSFVFFRGVLSSIIPLLTVGMVAAGASGMVVLAASVFGYKVDASLPSLVSTVLIGIGVDYFLFMTFRFRERLRAGDERKQAAASAGARISHVVASAALAIMVAFAALGMAQFGQFRVLGPSIAIAIAVMLLAGITLVPAVLAASGRKLFWPAKHWQNERQNGPATRIGALVARRPARVAVLATGLLAAFAVAATGVRMNYDAGIAKTTQSAKVESQIAHVLPRGVIDPQRIYISSPRPLTPASLSAMRARLAHVPHVAQVSEPRFAAGRRAAEVDVALNINSTTSPAINLAQHGGPLRDAVHTTTPLGATAMVGGTASVYADVSNSINKDLRLIFPIAAILILLILIAMLRSVVAPLYLLAAVGLEFAGTLGAAVLVFQHAGAQPGVAFTLPLVLFLFVVAIGTDYNMLISDRLREEFASGATPRQAVASAIRHAAPPITAAGLVLATSFGSLMIYDDHATKQMGFGMALGILFASFVVSTLLVPALTALVGKHAWWPSDIAREPGNKPREPRPTLTPIPHSK
jgi:putative drug exporter of the RND superfamily